MSMRHSTPGSIRVPGRSAFIYSRLVEHLRTSGKAGDEVQAGQRAGSIHPIGWSERDPVDVNAFNKWLDRLPAAPRSPDPEIAVQNMVDIPG